MAKRTPKRKPKPAAKRPARPAAHPFADLIERIGPEFIEAGARRITDRDVASIARSGERIAARFRGGVALSRFTEDAALLSELVADFWTGKYRKIPYWSIAMITFALSYVLKPIDIVPDVLPVIGEIDDVVVFSLCARRVGSDVRAYRVWKAARRRRPAARRARR